MRFETLLFHTRFRELAFNSLKTILQLKSAGLKKVVLAHVIPREDVAFVPYGGTLKDDIQRFQEEARVTFDDWIRTLADPQITFTQRIEIGAPNAKILEMAEEESVDLIVVGRKKRTLMEKVYVGTHVLDVLRRSSVPVLMSKYMVQYEWQGESLMRTNDQIWQRPLLATDWSDPSRRALDATLAMRPLVEKSAWPMFWDSVAPSTWPRKRSRRSSPRATGGFRPTADRSKMPVSPMNRIWPWDERSSRSSSFRETTMPR